MAEVSGAAADIEIEVDDPAWRAVPEVEGLVRRAAEAVMHGAGEGGTIAILLTDDDAVQALNARFRGRDAPTNVLSFPAAPSARPQLGDVALAYGVCAGEAAAQGKRLADHLSHLVVHGVLHLLGYDHLEDDEAHAMEARERDILAALGVADPYLAEAELG